MKLTLKRLPEAEQLLEYGCIEGERTCSTTRTQVGGEGQVTRDPRRSIAIVSVVAVLSLAVQALLRPPKRAGSLTTRLAYGMASRISEASGRSGRRWIGKSRGHPAEKEWRPRRASSSTRQADEFRTQPSALASSQENFKSRKTEDPQTKCYQAGVPRATYLPSPLQIRAESRPSGDRLPGRAHLSCDLHGRAASLRSRRLVDGRLARPMGGEHARRQRQGPERPDLVSTRPETFTARRCTSSSAIRSPGRTLSNTKPRCEDPKVFTRPWTLRVNLIPSPGAGLSHRRGRV